MERESKPIRRVLGIQDSTAEALRFLTPHLEQRAAGTLKLQTSVGLTVELPQQVLKFPSLKAARLCYKAFKHEEQKAYDRRNDEDEPPPPESLTDEMFDYLVGVLTGQHRRQLKGAVDGIFADCVIENIRNVKRVIDLTTKDRPKYAKLLLDEMSIVEESLRNELSAHRADSSGCCHHSIPFGLNLPISVVKDVEGNRVRPPVGDQGGIEHTLYCPTCCRPQALVRNLIHAVDTMHPLPEGHPETKDSLRQYVMEQISPMFDKFINHCHEISIESDTSDKILSQLRVHKDILFLHDFKMGYPPTRAEEPQTDHFGKSSESWHGTSVVWKNADASFHLQFFDTFARNGGAQDGFMVRCSWLLVSCS